MLQRRCDFVPAILFLSGRGAAIQVIDSNTGAHFRFDKEWKLQLGGDFYGDDLSALFKKQVTEIEMREEGGVNIYINA